MKRDQETGQSRLSRTAREGARKVAEHGRRAWRVIARIPGFLRVVVIITLACLAMPALIRDPIGVSGLAQPVLAFGALLKPKHVTELLITLAALAHALILYLESKKSIGHRRFLQSICGLWFLVAAVTVSALIYDIGGVQSVQLLA